MVKCASRQTVTIRENCRSEHEQAESAATLSRCIRVAGTDVRSEVLDLAAVPIPIPVRAIQVAFAAHARDAGHAADAGLPGFPWWRDAARCRADRSNGPAQASF